MIQIRTLDLPSPKTAPPIVADGVSPGPVYRFSVDQYQRMTAAGILTEDDHVELLDGWIVAMMARNPPHDCLIALLMELFYARCSRAWAVRVRSALDLSTSQPEPDLAIFRRPGRLPWERHPGPRDVALVVEVAAASLDLDRGLKRAIYARDRIPVYWVVDVEGRVVEVFTQPRAIKGSIDYRARSVYGLGDVVPLVARGSKFEGIAVADLFPPP